MSSKDIFLLVDYRDQFYFSTRYRGASVDTRKLAGYFLNHGFNLIRKHFYEIDFREQNYKNAWVLYQSSEDPGLRYKDYIEDILLGLQVQGAKLIPDFPYFRAHHNKVFMEILRDLSSVGGIWNLQAHSFGTYQEYRASKYSHVEEPLVIKPGSGTRSRGVRLLRSPVDKAKIPFRISRSFTLENVKLFLSKLKTGKPFTAMSNNRRKFIVQTFIEGLSGDYRILAYGKKFYVVYRRNRKNSFTASGSGDLDFNAVIPSGLLDFAKMVYQSFDTPYMSLDIGHKSGEFFLFEFQCLCLGQYTMEKSTFYYSQSSSLRWEKTNEKPDLEREIAQTVAMYIQRKSCAG